MAAVLSVVVSLLVALIVTSDFLDLPFAVGLGFTEALALAGILSLSSLGLVAKVLADDGHLCWWWGSPSASTTTSRR